ncbi:Bax inhibitor-1/YccA family protein [Psychrobacter sp. I-STPA10]|uniref:Bax inhibitor-1/YccA family protein n=1 Tax=Psychrobacter sp. I-STPA10 TaxID=2585769 RepID=UPI001E338D40|nr:Bax inhibitor-1/YccA family protein [Psychrobacter sp. I-STPA10]
MANPIVSRTELSVGGRAMTVKGVIQKTSFLLGLTTVAALGFFFFILTQGMSGSFLKIATFGSMFAALGLAIFITFKPQMAKTLAAPYAILEGIFLGGISTVFMSYAPSIPLTALSATFVTAAIMLGLYSTGVIKVTEKFRSIMMSAIFAIMLIYIVQWIMSLAFSSSLPFLFDGGIVAIGFSLFVVCIASFSLLLDFDNVERGVAAGVSEDFEWLFSISILASLVWMYIEFMRLLSYLQD